MVGIRDVVKCFVMIAGSKLDPNFKTYLVLLICSSRAPILAPMFGWPLPPIRLPPAPPPTGPRDACGGYLFENASFFISLIDLGVSFTSTVPVRVGAGAVAGADSDFPAVPFGRLDGPGAGNGTGTGLDLSLGVSFPLPLGRFTGSSFVVTGSGAGGGVTDNALFRPAIINSASCPFSSSPLSSLSSSSESSLFFSAA